MTYWTSHASSPARCDLTFVRSTSERLWPAPSRPSDPPPPRKTFGCKACWIRERDPSLAIPRGSNRSCGISSPTRSNSRPRAGALHLQRVNSHVEIIVSDTGQGISPAVLPFVFDRFRQADSSSTRRHGGLGLGLALVKHLVELHGGSVAAQSSGEGQGATFIVR